MPDRVYMSPPDVGDDEMAAVARAMESGWVAPLGPEVDAFEIELAQACEVPYALALSSGTAALHLALLSLGVHRADTVVVPTLTFAATAFAVTYTGARPVFVDSESNSWNLDPTLLAEYLHSADRRGKRPAAVLPVDLLGRPADYESILPICARYDVPVLVDAAESLGARHLDTPAGTMGHAGVYSFNGNKIITTSGGGMLVSHDKGLIDHARYLSTQARQPVSWYEHEHVGFNYRLSNLLAALGRAQLARLPSIVGRRRAIRDRYREHLASIDGLTVADDPPWGQSNGWLTALLLPEDGPAPSTVISALGDAGYEARHLWMPMHQQPVYSEASVVGGSVADDLFARGVCLPSGNRMTDGQIDDVAGIVAGVVRPTVG